MSNLASASRLAGEHAIGEAADELQTSLANLSNVKSRMDDLHSFLASSISRNQLIGKVQMDAVKSEIASAIRHIIINGSTLLACTQSSAEAPDLKFEHFATVDVAIGKDTGCDLVEHVHFCQICGKGFKRDSNLRMHMRAHGNQFKTREALTKPPLAAGCYRSKKFKSVMCFEHPEKSFSVAADMKSCDETRWMCSCGTNFSRKDKLFGHMALFEGHMPAVAHDAEKLDQSPMSATAKRKVGEGYGNGSLLDIDGLFDDWELGSSSFGSGWDYDQLYEDFRD